MAEPDPPARRAGRRFTAEDLTAMPGWGLRAEVLDGRLVLAPPPSRQHERVIANLAARFRLVLPPGVWVREGPPVRLPGGDVALPDLAVAARLGGSGLPPVAVHTAVEVVAGDGRFLDRVWKRDCYAGAGIPCYWRVELTAWHGYRGPLPVVVVRVRTDGGWREIIAVAGRVHPVPLACGRTAGGVPVTVPVRLDPGSLPVRYAAGR
jgi:Uma2 family endonuclease